jgi:hypothetical protein
MKRECEKFFPPSKSCHVGRYCRGSSSFTSVAKNPHHEQQFVEKIIHLPGGELRTSGFFSHKGCMIKGDRARPRGVGIIFA